MAIFVTIYYVLSYIEIVPQMNKLIKTKSSNDYSLGIDYFILRYYKFDKAKGLK